MEYKVKDLKEQTNINAPEEMIVYRTYSDTEVRLENVELRRMQRMEQALYYMMDHVRTNDCSLKGAAQAAGYEETYFLRTFPDYFEMPFERFLTRLKLREAARLLQDTKYPKNLGKRFGYENAQTFSRAFAREIGTSPRSFFAGNYMIPDMPDRKCLEGFAIRLEYQQVHALHMQGVPIRPEKGNDTYLMDAAAYAFKRGKSTWLRKCWEGQELAGMWWYDDNWELHYLFGPVLKHYDAIMVSQEDHYALQADQIGPVRRPRNAPEAVAQLVQGGNYAVFSYRRPDNDEKIHLMSRILCRYVMKEWIPLNHKVADKMGYTYELFTEDRVYLYLPLVFGMEGSDELLHRKWGISQWAMYIDRHITEELSLKSLAKIAGYSQGHYREVFSMYYGITPSEYILRRRLYLAQTEMFSNLEKWESIIEKYHFQNWEKFEQSYIREFGAQVLQPGLREIRLPDLIQYYEQNKDRVYIMMRNLLPTHVLLRKIMESQEEDVPDDLTAALIYRFKTEFSDFKQVREAFRGQSGSKHKVFIWGDGADEDNVQRYFVGSVYKKEVNEELLEKTRSLPDTVEEYIPGGRYAMFYTPDRRDAQNPEGAFRLLTRTAFGGWINENRYRVDLNRRTFVMWRNKKLYFYVPIVG